MFLKTLIKASIIAFLPIFAVFATNSTQQNLSSSLLQDEIAQVLGWVPNNSNDCCGYFVDEPFLYENIHQQPNDTVAISSKNGTVSLKGTSILENKVIVTRFRQQLTSEKAYLYRDPQTGKLTTVDLLDHVRYRVPNTIIVGDKGFYQFDTGKKRLQIVAYRTALKNRQFISPTTVPLTATEMMRPIRDMTAWGTADEFLEPEPLIYDFTNTTFSTCSPINPTWQLKAKTIELNKNIGRGYATHARFLLHGVPVFYIPYLNFSIDNTRKSGFLWPKIGYSNRYGTNGSFPYYWNIAPNYDMLFTAGLMATRGVSLNDYFRYLTPTSRGTMNLQVIPYDVGFVDFQNKTRKRNDIEPIVNPTQPQEITNAELVRLFDASATRYGFTWRDDSRYNVHWSSYVDFNLVSDDYFYRDYPHNLNQITDNFLLQEASLYYKDENWRFTGRLQGYQTLHPFDETFILNQYRRFPQLILVGGYPDQLFGLDAFLQTEFTNFTLVPTPGWTVQLPVGTRTNIQPGISLPLYWPHFYLNPRIQVSLTSYNLNHNGKTVSPDTINRVIPIYDVLMGMALEKNIDFFNYHYKQTLEPQVYYTYIPFHKQSNIPLFDTTLNTLLYDQIFTYNRFTGLDRIGDANQLAYGLTTRFIDQETGLEKIRAGLGQIYYFANRRVSLCYGPCDVIITNPPDEYSLSPLTGYLNITVSPLWSVTSNALWNPITKQLDLTTINFHFQTDSKHILNLGYSYARNADYLPGIPQADFKNNLSVTTVSFATPLFVHNLTFMGLWSQNWNRQHLQNLLYGLQYETCCWAARAVGGKAFTGYDTETKDLKYDKQYYVELSLKGLGNVGTGSGKPDRLLGSIAGYNTQFGQDL